MAKEPFAARLTSIWIGAAFFWLIKGFKGSYKDQTAEKYDQRNMWTGYLLMIIALVLVVYFWIVPFGYEKSYHSPTSVIRIS